MATTKTTLYLSLTGAFSLLIVSISLLSICVIPRFENCLPYPVTLWTWRDTIIWDSTSLKSSHWIQHFVFFFLRQKAAWDTSARNGDRNEGRGGVVTRGGWRWGGWISSGPAKQRVWQGWVWCLPEKGRCRLISSSHRKKASQLAVTWLSHD